MPIVLCSHLDWYNKFFRTNGGIVHLALNYCGGYGSFLAFFVNCSLIAEKKLRKRKENGNSNHKFYFLGLLPTKDGKMKKNKWLWQAQLSRGYSSVSSHHLAKNEKKKRHSQTKINIIFLKFVFFSDIYSATKISIIENFDLLFGHYQNIAKSLLVSLERSLRNLDYKIKSAWFTPLSDSGYLEKGMKIQRTSISLVPKEVLN